MQRDANLIDGQTAVMSRLDTISYNPETGLFTWSVARPGCRLGAQAGSVNSDGYRVVKVGKRPVLAHRLAWLISFGAWPNGPIDHINGDRQDNRLSNLRVVDHATNMQNKRQAMSNNKSCGLLGVTWNKQHKRWQSKLMANKKAHHIGYFDCPEAAHAAYVSAKRQLQLGCTI